MKKVLVTAGPIPARLDSVKYITNRFQGSMALDTAYRLMRLRNEVTLCCWKYSKTLIKAATEKAIPVVTCDDVDDYINKVLEFEADAYVLAAAVANLVPAQPWEGKFPSHAYRDEDIISIPFKLAPRLVTRIKERHPRATLIGYKLFDGPHEELIEAAYKVLTTSRANLVIANDPKHLDSKYMITADGAVFAAMHNGDSNSESAVSIMNRLINESWYRTEIRDVAPQNISPDQIEYMSQSYPLHLQRGSEFGTFAIRDGNTNGFVTTVRGKKTGDKDIAYVQGVDHVRQVVTANKRATLNAPLLHSIFALNPHINYLVHGHVEMGEFSQSLYQFPGTAGDNLNAIKFEGERMIQLPHHGYIACQETYESCQHFASMWGRG